MISADNGIQASTVCQYHCDSILPHMEENPKLSYGNRQTHAAAIYRQWGV